MTNNFELHPTFCFTLLGTFMIHVWTRPSRMAWLAVLIVAAGLRLSCIGIMGGLGNYYGVWWISWGAFLGLASLIVLWAQIARSRVRLTDPESAVSKRKILRQTFYAGAVFPACSLLIGYAVLLTNWLRPKTYDAFLLAIDGSLGFQPSFAVGRLLRWGSNYWGTTTIVYYALPCVVSILYASHLAQERAGERKRVSILPLFLSMMVAGSVLYAVYPAVGPKHAFGELYPWNPPLLAQITIRPMTVTGLRNCMPSLHLAGALAVWWNSRLWRPWGRVLAALFLCATIFSTLSLGEHYLVDLVVAVPFTLVLQAAWTVCVPLTESVRWRPLAVGTTLTAAWFVTLRYGLWLFLASPFVLWSAMLLTVGWCLVLENQLDA